MPAFDRLERMERFEQYGTNGFLAVLPWRQSLPLSHATCQLLYTVPGIGP